MVGRVYLNKIYSSCFNFGARAQSRCELLGGGGGGIHKPPPTDHRTHTLAFVKTSAFPVSPNNARTSSSTSWFSGWRGRNLSLVTRCSPLPLHLHPLTTTHPPAHLHLNTPRFLSVFSLSLALFLMSLTSSFHLLTFASLRLPHTHTGPHRLQRRKIKKTSSLSLSLACRKRQQVQTSALRLLFFFPTDSRMFSRS